MPRVLLALAMCCACAPSDPKGPGVGTGVGGGTSGGTPSGASSGAPGGTHGGTPGGTTGLTGPVVRAVDCTQLLPLPLVATSHAWVPSHEDFTFSPDGRWVGTNAGHLKATPFGGPAEIVVPSTGDARGTRFLPDGTLLLALVDVGTIVRVDPVTGSTTPVVSGLTNPNGIAIGWDGLAYVATTGQILRLDPDTGITEVVAEMPGHSFDGLTFTPDYRRLYFNEEIGRINFVDFDADGNPGNPVFVADMPIAAFSLLDGMTMDACGNLYAVEMSGKLWRVTPAGVVELAIDLPPGFVPAVNFAPDAGGFDPLAIYVQDFLGKMYEAPVGVPGKWEPHLPE